MATLGGDNYGARLGQWQNKVKTKWTIEVIVRALIMM